jgi:hypothetical protein
MLKEATLILSDNVRTWFDKYPDPAKKVYSRIYGDATQQLYYHTCRDFCRVTKIIECAYETRRAASTTATL